MKDPKELQKEVDQLTAENSKLKEENGQLQEKVTQLEADAGDLEDKVAALELKEKELQEKVDTLQANADEPGEVRQDPNDPYAGVKIPDGKYLIMEVLRHEGKRLVPDVNKPVFSNLKGLKPAQIKALQASKVIR